MDNDLQKHQDNVFRLWKNVCLSYRTRFSFVAVLFVCSVLLSRKICRMLVIFKVSQIYKNYSIAIIIEAN